MRETITYGQFQSGLARLGYAQTAIAAGADLPVKRTSSVVAAAVAEHGLTLAELNLIFKGA